jgi:cellulose synthase/poly-beta-1,6-N-acetylglucosamine synthase-like glycosyltransferase
MDISGLPVLDALTLAGIVFFVLFVGLHCALMGGLVREWRWEREQPAAQIRGRPGVSVIVPVHNESRRMGRLLKSLALQDYPNREYIFVDDRSDDEGPEMLAAFARYRGDCRIITLSENPGPNHKQFALGKGIKAAGGELFLFTDADCEVPPCWISAMVGLMADEKAGAVIAPVFKRNEKKGWFGFYQCIDHAIRYLYLTGSTGLGAAGGGFGNNLMVRRKSLECIGGYDSLPVSPTEDAALISRIRSHSEYRIHAASGAAVHVFTYAEETCRAFLNQTLRWNNGGLFSPDLLTRINFNYLMIAISAGILAIFPLPFCPFLWPLPLSVITAMIMNTLAMILLFRSSLPEGGLFYIIQLVLTPAWMTLLTILGFCGVKTRWKDGPAL